MRQTVRGTTTPLVAVSFLAAAAAVAQPALTQNMIQDPDQRKRISAILVKLGA